MKRNFIILITLFYNFSLFAQFQDTLSTYRNDSKKPYWIIQCESETDNQCQLTIYFEDGTVKGTGKLSYTDRNLNNRYRPSGDMILRFPDGSVYQKYTYETGILLTYYSTGELAEKMISPIDSTMEYHYKYYKNGDIWMDKRGQRQKGQQNIRIGSVKRTDNMRSNIISRLIYEKIYHSNGNLQSHTFFDDDKKRFVFLFYSPNGQLDSTATYDNNRYKNGRRYQYHSNGQLKEILDYKRNEGHGEFSRWATNGQQTIKTQMKNGRYDGKYESWWDDGSLREISYYNKYNNKNGPTIRQHHDGRVLEQGTYYNRNSIGLATVWDTLGDVHSNWHGGLFKANYNLYKVYVTQIISPNTYWIKGEGEWKNKLRDGEWTFHYVKLDKKTMNVLCAVQSYKNGLLDGKAVVYFPDSTLMVTTSFKDGMLDGEYEEYYESGSIYQKGNFENHQKKGLWTTYFENGKPRIIEAFKDDENKEVVKEWDKDGFLKQERILGEATEDAERFVYNRDGSYTKYVIPAGWNWEYGHFDMYDKLKNLERSRIYKDNTSKNYTETYFYKNGNKKSEATVENRKRNGTFYSWYDDGSPKSEIPYKDGFENGRAYFWKKSGKRTVKQYYQGNEIEINPDVTTGLVCECNHLHKKDRFPPSSLNDHTSYSDISKRTPNFIIPKKVYKSFLVSRYVHDIMSHHRKEYISSGTLVMYDDVKIKTKSDLELNFTPCRQGNNPANIKFYATTYGEEQEMVYLTLSDFDLSVAFPEKLLCLYDEKNQQRIATTKSSVRVAVKRLEYNVEKNTEIEIRIEQDSDSTSCFQISEIGSTGFLFQGENPRIYFAPKYYENEFLNYDIGNSTDDWTGVLFKNGTLEIPYNNDVIKGETRNVFVNGTTIYGEVMILLKNNSMLKDVDELSKYFGSKGFKITNSRITDAEVITLVWKYED